ncbi:flagellar export protein FliJ [candidate division KSB1 bacterium]
MRRFSFRMQRILNIKQSMEELRKNEFGLANRKLLEEKVKEEKINENIGSYQKMFADLTKKKISPIYLYSHSRYQSFLLAELDRKREDIKQSQNELEKQREKLNQAIKERKTLEKLKEKNFENYKFEFEKEDQKEIDESTSQLYNYYKER